MNRIKFRALVKYPDEQKPVWEYYPTLVEPVWLDPNVASIIAIDLQFTGYFDRNGKEIYARDIVRAIGKIGWSLNTVISDIIQSDGGQWQIRSIDKDKKMIFNHGLPIAWGGWSSVEVIGNTHENPELLNS